MAGTTSLVNQFDDIVAATGVLCAGTEGGEKKDNTCHQFMKRSLDLVILVLIPYRMQDYIGYVLLVFAQFVDHQRTLHTRLQDMVDENAQLKVSIPLYVQSQTVLTITWLSYRAYHFMY